MMNVKVVVSGYVQGVGFRFSTQMKANELGIKGYVKNQYDGTVLVMASAEEKTLNEFIAWLRIGPRSARVKDLKIDYLEDNENFKDFKVKYV